MPDKQKKPITSRSSQAGLVFPISKVNRHLRESGRTKRVGAGAPIYLASVLELACAELLEVAGKQLEGSKRKRIMPTDLSMAMRADPELTKLFSGVSVFSGCRVKDVCKAVTLVPKKKEAAKAAE